MEDAKVGEPEQEGDKKGMREERSEGGRNAG